MASKKEAEAKDKLKYAVAYFSSQINAEENKGLEMSLQPTPEGGTGIWTCKTGNGMQWVGKRDASLMRATRLVLLARDRRTGHVTVASAETDAFRFLPVCVVDAADAPAAPAAGKRKRPASQPQQQQQATAMYEEFGSTAKKRRIAEAKRLNASVTSRDLKAAVTTATKRLEQSSVADASAASVSAAAPGPHLPLPPRDPRTGFFAEDAVCPSRLRAALLPEAERLADAGDAQVAAWRGAAAYPDALVLQRLPRLPAERPRRLEACVRLAMLASMRRFHGMGYKLVNRKGALPDLAEEVGRYLLDNYTEQVITSTGQHRSLTPQAKDKQLMHMIILCLQMDGYSTDIDGLMNEFRLASPRLQKLLKMIGCHVATEQRAGGQQPVKVARLNSS